NAGERRGIAEYPHVARVRWRRGSGRQLPLGRRLRRRVSRLSLLVQQRRLRRARHSSGGPARARSGPRAGRGGSRRPCRARRARRDRDAAQRARGVPRAPLGRARPRRRGVARLLAEEARLPRRLARPPRQGGQARGRVRRGECRVLVPRPTRRAGAARAAADAELARAPVPPMSVPRPYALAGPAYLAALLAVDTHVGLHGQLVLGGSTWLLLLAALRPLPALARAQALAVVAF